MFDESLWEEGRKKAELELKDLPIQICTGKKGFRGGRPVVFLDVAVKGNKGLVDELMELGWRTFHGMNVQGKRIQEFQKTF